MEMREIRAMLFSMQRIGSNNTPQTHLTCCWVPPHLAAKDKCERGIQRMEGYHNHKLCLIL
jgi:hypothetical protein